MIFPQIVVVILPLTAGTNITLVPGTNSITIDASGSGSSTEGVSLFVVDSQGNAGYTTIQAAIDAAAMIATSTTPQTVWIWPGTYAESGSLALAPFVNLASAAGSVYITAACTLTSTGTADTFLCTSIAFNTTSGTRVIYCRPDKC